MYRTIFTLFLLLFSVSGFQGLAQSKVGYASNSVLSTGDWYKVGINETGIQRLTYSDLSSLGLDIDHVNPRNLRVYHNGGGVLNELNAEPRFDDLVEIPIYVEGESDGKFDRDDYVLFYARGPVTWWYSNENRAYVHHPNAYDDYSYAFITADLGQGQRIQTAPQPSGSVDVTIGEFLAI